MVFPTLGVSAVRSGEMSTNLNEYLNRYRTQDGFGLDGSSFPLAKRIVCADGFSLSVQATHGAYCSPRNNTGPWHEVEVGFPSAAPELIMNRAEDPEKPTKTVYGYVDIELVEQLIDMHGGIVHQEEVAK
jgi:hypothetical protein